MFSAYTVFLIAWGILTIVLIILLIQLNLNYKSLKLMYENLCKKDANHIYLPAQRPLQGPPRPPEGVHTPKPAIPSEVVKPTQVPPSVGNTKEEKNKKVINITLVVGMLFILTAGLIFATTTWNLIPNHIKVFCLVLIAFFFFSVSLLIRKFLKIRLTEIAFFQLGCFFLCSTVISIGYFGLFGPWFSLSGSGRPFVFLITAIFLFALSVLGYYIYKVPYLHYLSWGSSASIIWFLAESFGQDSDVCWLIVSIYGVIVISRMLFKNRKEWLLYAHPIMVFFCIYQSMNLFLPNATASNIVGIISFTSVFLFYHFSAKLFPFSLNTKCSQFLFLASLGINLIFNIFASRGMLGLFNGIAFSVCLLCILKASTNKTEKQIFAGAFITTVGLIQFSLMEILISTFLLSTEISITILFSFLAIIILILDHSPLNKKNITTYVPFINILVAPMALYGYIICNGNLYGTIILWELFLVWILEKRNSFCFPNATIIFLFLPLFTIENVMPVGEYERKLLFIFTGLIVYLTNHYFKNDYKKLVLKHIGSVGLFIGFATFYSFFCDDFYFDHGIYGYGIISLSIMLLLAVWGWKNKEWILHSLCIFLVPILFTTLIDIFKNENTFPIIIGLATSICLAYFGRILYPNILEIKENKTIQYIDVLGISSIFGLSILQNANHKIFYTFLFMVPWCLNWYKRKNNYISNISMGLSIVFGFLVWVCQPFISIPTRFIPLFLISGILITYLAIFLAWREHKKLLDKYVIYVAIVCTLIQYGSCILFSTFYNVFILGVAMLCILCFAFKTKLLRWLKLSLTTLTFLVLYLSRDFWFSLNWWVFLLIIGFILIGVAANHEYNKRRKKNNVDSIFKDWK